MNQPKSDESNLDDRLGGVIAQFLVDEENGLVPDRTDLFARHPDLVDELKLFFDQHDWIRGKENGTVTISIDRTVLPVTGNGKAINTASAEVVECEIVGRTTKTQDFGDYELISEIGRGGMGVVYKARQRSLNRIVAIKTMLPGSSYTAGELTRFKKEAVAAARIRHPNILAIHDIGVHDDRQFFSMDYVEGCNLKEMISRGPLDPICAARYIRDIARAVHQLHEHGLLHRDIKPSNVMIDRSDKPFITDFGLAKNLGDRSDLTASGATVGTPSYMSPEQIQGDKRLIGPKTDVYSLGGVLYAAITGYPPFGGSSSFQTMHQSLVTLPVPPSCIRPAIPPRLEAICLKALAKSPMLRHVSAEEFAREIDQFLANPDLPVPPISASKTANVAQISAISFSVACLLAVLVLAWIPIAGALIVPAALVGVCVFGFRTNHSQPERKAAKIAVASGCLAIAITVGLQLFVAPPLVRSMFESVGTFVVQETNWREFASTWQPIPTDAKASRLFPVEIREQKRVTMDARAELPELGIDVPGHHAVYESGESSFQVYAYSVSTLEKEAIFARVIASLASEDETDMSARPGIWRTHGAIERWSVGLESYEGEAAFWWDGNWLFLVKSDSQTDEFLLRYVRAIGSAQ